LAAAVGAAGGAIYSLAQLGYSLVDVGYLSVESGDLVFHRSDLFRQLGGLFGGGVELGRLALEPVEAVGEVATGSSCTAFAMKG
jgi:hypothetical protein